MSNTSHSGDPIATPAFDVEGAAKQLMARAASALQGDYQTMQLILSAVRRASRDDEKKGIATLTSEVLSREADEEWEATQDAVERLRMDAQRLDETLVERIAQYPWLLNGFVRLIAGQAQQGDLRFQTLVQTFPKVAEYLEPYLVHEIRKPYFGGLYGDRLRLLANATKNPNAAEAVLYEQLLWQSGVYDEAAKSLGATVELADALLVADRDGILQVSDDEKRNLREVIQTAREESAALEVALSEAIMVALTEAGTGAGIPRAWAISELNRRDALLRAEQAAKSYSELCKRTLTLVDQQIREEPQQEGSRLHDQRGAAVARLGGNGAFTPILHVLGRVRGYVPGARQLWFTELSSELEEAFADLYRRHGPLPVETPDTITTRDDLASQEISETAAALHVLAERDPQFRWLLEVASLTTLGSLNEQLANAFLRYTLGYSEGHSGELSETLVALAGQVGLPRVSDEPSQPSALDAWLLTCRTLRVRDARAVGSPTAVETALNTIRIGLGQLDDYAGGVLAGVAARNMTGAQLSAVHQQTLGRSQFGNAIWTTGVRNGIELPVPFRRTVRENGRVGGERGNDLMTRVLAGVLLTGRELLETHAALQAMMTGADALAVAGISNDALRNAMRDQREREAHVNSRTQERLERLHALMDVEELPAAKLDAFRRRNDDPFFQALLPDPEEGMTRGMSRRISILYIGFQGGHTADQHVESWMADSLFLRGDVRTLSHAVTQVVGALAPLMESPTNREQFVGALERAGVEPHVMNGVTSRLGFPPPETPPGPALPPTPSGPTQTPAGGSGAQGPPAAPPIRTGGTVVPPAVESPRHGGEPSNRQTAVVRLARPPGSQAVGRQRPVGAPPLSRGSERGRVRSVQAPATVAERENVAVPRTAAPPPARQEARVAAAPTVRMPVSRPAAAQDRTPDAATRVRRPAEPQQRPSTPASTTAPRTPALSNAGTRTPSQRNESKTADRVEPGGIPRPAAVLDPVDSVPSTTLVHSMALGLVRD